MITQLLSLPVAAAKGAGDVVAGRGDFYLASDPPGEQLGSGGGTAHLLASAWADRAGETSFADWLNSSRKLLVHGSGQSRRLPAYAAPGKPLIPIPFLDGVQGQRPDQMLLDLQVEVYRRFFRHAPASYRVMITCGDVLLQCRRWLPGYPETDVLLMGIESSPEEAQSHGVMICPADAPSRLKRFVQKPPLEDINELAKTHSFCLDTGVWLLSERAVMTLMAKCGWQAGKDAFSGGTALRYDLFAGFGPALGEDGSGSDPEIGRLSCAVMRLPKTRFYHFGTNRSLMASVTELREPAAGRISIGHASMERPGAPVIQHSNVQCNLGGEHRHIWIDNSHIARRWALSERHVLSGVPENKWELSLDPGICLDFVPVGRDAVCVRPYGFDDQFRGKMYVDDTLWMGKAAARWISSRGITMEGAGIDPSGDIQDAPLFPVVPLSELDETIVRWLIDSGRGGDGRTREKWLNSRRVSAREILTEADVAAYAERRQVSVARTIEKAGAGDWSNMCSSLDLKATAEMFPAARWPVDGASGEERTDLWAVHEKMLLHTAARQRGESGNERFREEAFARLRKRIVDEIALASVEPHRNVLEDQIVWGRSPVRLDLAGGWSDTPPYCMEHGGRVVNLAADLNGQPPIQVFGRICDREGILIRSIDLGIDEEIAEYEDLDDPEKPGSGFSIAKAALALSGLSPRFHVRGGQTSLRKQLSHDLGGGIELSMVCAVPKGSGLGTSSILAATLLGTLDELFGFGWSLNDIFRRTMALEQIITAGGGWQDQVGGITRGLKLVETDAGDAQKPVIRWLPDHFFSGGYANEQVLLYYTGLTRVAHDILGEIVCGLFLNSASHLSVIEDISLNALYAAEGLQRSSWEGLCEAVRRSWRLNQELDSGTNPREVQEIISRIDDYVSACKLPGAGGGGYLLMFAKDMDAASRIRETLLNDPPNARARFVDLDISREGFQVTRS